MNQNRFPYYFLIFLLGVSGILLFFIFKPFLIPLILALVCAVVLQPIYKKLLHYLGAKQGLASFLTILLVVTFILIPLAVIILFVVRDARDFYVQLASAPLTSFDINPILNPIFGTSSDTFSVVDFSNSIEQYTLQFLNWIMKNFGILLSGFTQIFSEAIVFLISLYYLLKDGKRLRSLVISISPLADSSDRHILDKLEVAVNSVVRGNFLIALIQGLLATSGFVIFGIPNPFLWGSLAAVVSLIPTFGTSIITIPAIIYLFVTGHTLQAFGLIVWATLIVGSIDNFIGPKIVGKGTDLHPLIVLLAVLGGIVFLGPSGIIFGPLIVILFLTLIEVLS